MLRIHRQRTVSAPHPNRSVARGGHAVAVALAGLVLLAGCASPTSQTSSLFGGLLESSQAQTPTAAAVPVQSACEGAAQCSATLKTMIDSPDRGWIGQRQPPKTYANGTRLFAYKALRPRLTCSELNLAVNELAATSRSLTGAVAGMSPDQLSRTRALCNQVESELARERESRCRT